MMTAAVVGVGAIEGVGAQVAKHAAETGNHSVVAEITQENIQWSSPRSSS